MGEPEHRPVWCEAHPEAGSDVTSVQPGPVLGEERLESEAGDELDVGVSQAALDRGQLDSPQPVAVAVAVEEPMEQREALGHARLQVRPGDVLVSEHPEISQAAGERAIPGVLTVGAPSSAGPADAVGERCGRLGDPLAQGRHRLQDFVIHGRQLDKTIELSGPMRASRPKIEALLQQIDCGLIHEEENLKRLIEGTGLALDQIRAKALHNWYLPADEALQLGLVTALI